MAKKPTSRLLLEIAVGGVAGLMFIAAAFLGIWLGSQATPFHLF